MTPARDATVLPRMVDLARQLHEECARELAEGQPEISAIDSLIVELDALSKRYLGLAPRSLRLLD